MTIRLLKSINKKRRRGDTLSSTVTDGACSQQRQDQAGGPRGPAERPGFQAALRVPPGKKDDSDRQHRALPEERYCPGAGRAPSLLCHRHSPGDGLPCSSRCQECTLFSSKPDSLEAPCCLCDNSLGSSSCHIRPGVLLSWVAERLGTGSDVN